MITLRQLRYFVLLAKHCHFGRAASEGAISQPALSMQIRALEREVGAELVERRPGEVALTEIGREVAGRAEHILAAARDLVDAARHREVLTGPLRLGIIPTLAPYMLPRLLPRLQKAHAGLRLEMRETQTATLVQELLAGDLDCLLVALPLEGGAEVETLALFEDRFLLAAPADERLPARRLTVDDVDPRRLFLLEEGHCLRDQALAFCTTRRRDAPARLGSTSLATVMQMVANGYGATLLPEIAADVEARDPRIRLGRFAAPEPGRTIGLAWRRTSSRRHDFAALGELVKTTVTPAERRSGSPGPEQGA
ncbi:MAG TPA: hydrogen peroxide-inducible genes activator [Thermohalobaculum sp.]|nr:hydrogen peroxide-inducible genes activator [Thermohalobaculum sp.]